MRRTLTPSARFVAAATLLPALMTVAACSGTDGSAVPAPTSQTRPPATTPPTLPTADGFPLVTVTAKEEASGRYTLEAPSDVPAGWVMVELRNEGRLAHGADLLRPEAGSDASQVAELLAGPAPGAIPTLARMLGGPGVTPPGGRQRVLVKLDAGPAFVASFAPGADGKPDVSRGMFRPITVRPAAGGHDQPTAPTVVLADDGITVPDELASRAGWYGVRNTGLHPHELLVLRRNEGASRDDVLAWLRATENGPAPGAAPFSYAGGVGPLDPGVTAFLDVALDPGTYLLVDRQPDPSRAGAPYHDSGVVADLRIG